MRHDQQYQKAFGKHLRRIRESRNWTQVDLATWSHVDETQISKIEHGEVGPNLQTIRVLALALGKVPKDLLDFEYPYALNVDFRTRQNRHRKTNLTARIRELFAEGFFTSPRSVSDIIKYCKSNYEVDLASDDTSGVLLVLVKQGVLRKIPLSKKRKNLYVTRT